MFLSIIVPVYNVEKYIRECLNSIFVNIPVQLMSEVEVIVVNDGTLDNSMVIVEEFAKVYSNLHVLSQENQGLSCARNSGLKIAQGEYVWFVDSDDQIQKDSLMLIKDRLNKNKAEIIGWNIIKINEVGGKESLERPMVKNKIKYNKVYNGLSAAMSLQNGMVQRYLFKRTFLEDNDLFFFPGIHYEDDEMLVKAFCCVNYIVCFDEIIYRYLVRESGSIMSSCVSLRSIHDVIVIINNWNDYSCDFSILYWKKQYINLNIFHKLCWVIKMSYGSYDKEVKMYYMEHKLNLKVVTIQYFIKSFQHISCGNIMRLLKTWFLY